MTRKIRLRSAGGVARAAVAALSAVAVVTGSNASAAAEPTYTTSVSQVSSRAGATGLSGADLSRAAYVFVSGDSIDRVRFWLDDPKAQRAPIRTEGGFPFDFVGGSRSAADPFDFAKLSTGSHSILVEVTFRSGATKRSLHSFTVRSATTPSPKPTATATATPTPTATATPKPTATATATPKPTATPTPTATATVKPPANFPNSSTTGVPAGTRLTPSGALNITKAGAVVEGLDINGCVRISANNVTLRKSRVRCNSGSSSVIKIGSGVTGALIEDVEVDGLDTSSGGVGSGNFTLRRGNVHSAADGIRAGSNSIVEYSWVHDLARQPGSHDDAVQTVVGNNIIIRYNYLQPWTEGDFMNAAYIFGPSLGPVSNVQVVGNLMDGGNYTLVGSGDRVTIKDNVFTRRHRYGPFNLNGPITLSNNRYSDGASISQ